MKLAYRISQSIGRNPHAGNYIGLSVGLLVLFGMLFVMAVGL